MDAQRLLIRLVLAPVVLATVALAATRPAAADWPRVAGPLPTVSMRVHAYFLSDDDGGRQTDISSAQVAAWVDEANDVFAGAGIHLDFDPSPGSGDWELGQSTLLNSMSGVDHPQWSQQVTAGDAAASLTPHDMVAYFRWGPDPNFPTGQGFSWTDYDFIAAPAFEYTTVGGHQNLGLFAHEAGHYLGLAHTFGPTFNTVSQAQSYFIGQGHNPAVFDGDGRADTPPDPFVAAVQTDTSVTSLVLDGTEFPLPRSNIMSYYEPHGDVSPSQAWTMRQTLLLRSGQSLALQVSDTGGTVIEAELQAAQTSGGFQLDQNMSGFLGRWSGDTQRLWIDGGPDGELSFDLQVAEAGRYEVYAGFTAAPDFGIFEHLINGQPAELVDLYSAGVLTTGAVRLGRFDLNAGSNTWDVLTVGSNPLAVSRYGYGLDYIILVAVPEPGTFGLLVGGLLALAVWRWRGGRTR